MLKCTTNRYAGLYARWLSNPGSLLDLAKFNPSRDILLDLCGGTGAVSEEAVERGAKSVYLLDLNPRYNNPEVVTIKADAHNPTAYSFLPDIDLCVIRQSLGYLRLHEIAPILGGLLKPGARLAINGFLKPKWKLSFYEFNHGMFLEASAHMLGWVAHIQAAGAFGVDLSVFRHHEMRSVHAAFIPWFKVGRQELTDTSFRLVLVRKPTP